MAYVLNKSETRTLNTIRRAGLAGVNPYTLNLRHLGRLARNGYTTNLASGNVYAPPEAK